MLHSCTHLRALDFKILPALAAPRMGLATQLRNVPTWEGPTEEAVQKDSEFAVSVSTKKGILLNF